MKPFNANAVIEEGRRLLVLISGAVVVTAIVVFLDDKGGHLAAGLGVTAAAFAFRLLHLAAGRDGQ
jgi:hypothetical protein